MNFDTFAIVARVDLEEKLQVLKKDAEENPEAFEGMEENDWFESLTMVDLV